MEWESRRWLRELPADLAGQRTLLAGLLDLCESDAELGWLVIGCSLARGNADRWSDLDVAMGLGPVADFAVAARRVRTRVEGLGELVDSHAHQLPGRAGDHVRIFAQYADRCQLDLVLLPANAGTGFPAGTRILHDPAGLVAIAPPTPPPTPEQLREWAFQAWCALADLGKYLRRGSSWEALDRLHEARTHAWRLTAAARRVPDPQHGLTSFLDVAAEPVPAELAATVADLDATRLLIAAHHLAELLTRTADDLPEAARAQQPRAMARYVTEDLVALNQV